MNYRWLPTMLGITIYMDLPKRRYTRWNNLSLVNGNARSLFVLDKFMVWINPWLGDMKLFHISSNWIDSALPRQNHTSVCEMTETMSISTYNMTTFLFLERTTLAYWGGWTYSSHWREWAVDPEFYMGGDVGTVEINGEAMHAFLYFACIKNVIEKIEKFFETTINNYKPLF